LNIQVGGVGLALNILAAVVVHDHGDHGHPHGNGHLHKAHDDHPVRAGEEQQVSASIALQSVPDAHADHVHTTRVLSNKAGYDLGLLGAMIHLVGDALNSVAVMISAVIIWQAHWQRADGVASVVVSLMIIATAIPLLKRSGRLLLEIAPQGLDLEGVEKDIKSLKGVDDVHELHAYSLSK
jgi:zinc transporter 1